MVSRSLLTFVLPAFLIAPSLASTINVNPGDNAVAKVASAHSGDTVLFGAGTFNIGSPIMVPSGVTVSGVSVDATHVIFNIAGGNRASYGINIAGNAKNVTIENLDLVSNHGVIDMALGSAYTDIVISDNNFQYGAGQLADGTLVYGISGTILNDGLQIVHNYFHDSPSSVRNWCIFSATNANLDYNLFYNIADGGQIQFPGPNVSFSYNYGTMIHRMGQESALDPDSSLVCTGNVFYNYANVYQDSFGLSIIGNSGEVDLTDNYFGATIAPGSSWGNPDSVGTHRFGYAIECTGQPCNVTGNTFVGSWAAMAVSDTPNANASGNSVFGGALWNNFFGEPGPFGLGSVNATNNKYDRNTNDAPAPPANTDAGPRLPS